MDLFRAGGNPPQSEITLCFGEELSDEDDMAEKHIVIKVQNTQGLMNGKTSRNLGKTSKKIFRTASLGLIVVA